MMMPEVGKRYQIKVVPVESSTPCCGHFYGDDYDLQIEMLDGIQVTIVKEAPLTRCTHCGAEHVSLGFYHVVRDDGAFTALPYTFLIPLEEADDGP